MKKQKISLQLGKHKVSSLDKQQLSGGIIVNTNTTIQIVTIQTNCRTLFCPTETCLTLPSSCCSHTQTTGPFTLFC